MRNTRLNGRKSTYLLWRRVLVLNVESLWWQVSVGGIRNSHVPVDRVAVTASLKYHVRVVRKWRCYYTPTGTASVRARHQCCLLWCDTTESLLRLRAPLTDLSISCDKAADFPACSIPRVLHESYSSLCHAEPIGRPYRRRILVG